jgi:hypothetical protein
MKNGIHPALLTLLLAALPACVRAQQTESTQPPAKRVESTIVQVAEHEFCLEPILAKHTASERAHISGNNASKSTGFSLDRIPSICPVVQPAAHQMKELAMKLRFVDGPNVTRLTPQEKGKLAIHNLFEPFNLLTLTGLSAIAIATDSHSPYGPGFSGFGKNLGVSFTEDMTAQFFGTFLIPSIAHQDPHYHRMPNASVPRRILHTGVAVFWAQSDNGHGMPNYSTLLGSAIDGEIANLYVPGRRTDLRSTAQRYGVGMSLAPIDNLITEFLPDIAKHIHVHDVFIQRIVNSVAKSNQ